MPHKVLLDTDPGVDDAMALLFALRSPELEIVGVTTVFGNAEVEQTTLNALRVLQAGGRPDVPVAAGAARPLVRPYRGRKAAIHGEDGLGGAFVHSPPPAGRPLDLPAAQFIARTALAQPGELTLIAVGPLTNLALAARLEPRLASAVRRVILMGGAAFQRGNASPVAEANLYSDPEAAAIVFTAGWPLVMVGLDVTTRTVLTPAHLEDLARAGNPHADFVARITPFYIQAYRARYGIDGCYLHDPSAIACAIDPGMFQVQRLPMWIETEGRCAGQTVPDPYHQWGDAPETDVCVDVDSPRLLALFKERLTR
jgi:inosine-uridine nucleoside N-ribohydrolase